MALVRAGISLLQADIVATHHNVRLTAGAERDLIILGIVKRFGQGVIDGEIVGKPTHFCFFSLDCNQQAVIPTLRE